PTYPLSLHDALPICACAAEEAEIQARLGRASEAVTEVEVTAQRLRDQAAEAELELRGIAARLGLAPGEVERAEGEPAEGEAAADGRLDEEQKLAVAARLE